MEMKAIAIERLTEEFGIPVRETVKVKAWSISSSTGVVVQTDQPNNEDAAYIWLPHPGDGASIPEFALQYPAEAGRHSNTYASAGLERGEPALKCIVRTSGELASLIAYIRAMGRGGVLPAVEAEDISSMAGNDS